jgi:exopolysaccharide biosynthesis WecB/TagA/CpsF family protein
LARLAQRTEQDSFQYVVTPNVDHIVRLEQRPDLLPIYRDAWMTWCDSHPVRRLAQILGTPMPHLNGTNVMECVFASVLQPGDKLLAIVANEGILDALKRKFPSYHWSGICPSVGFENDVGAMASLVQYVVEHPARFIFIGVGAPRSEILASKILERRDAKGTAFCIGAALEFITGVKTRAPAFLRRLELEWLHRLVSEPSRLWRRYLLSFLPLLSLFLRELKYRGRDQDTAFRPVIGHDESASVSKTVRPLLLHISSDYTDGLGEKGEAGRVVASRQRRPTLAINNLVEGAEDFDHVVFSLRRTSSPLALYLKDIGAPQQPNVRVFVYAHYGLPLGVGLFHSFWLVARTVRRMLREHGLRPDAVHAHRLTFDGIAGWLLSRWLDIPLFISIRGEVESKVFKYKPTYRPLMRRIVERATMVFLVSAWFGPVLEKYTRGERSRTELLPNVVAEALLPAGKNRPGHALLTVVNLDIWEKKGLGQLLPAFAEARRSVPSLRLDIIGTGTATSVATVRRLIDGLGISDQVDLIGALPNDVVRERMSESMALVLPSHNETFGMVYLEALFAGVPILYSKDTGIDGFLDGLDVGVAVDPDKIDEIACALAALAKNNEYYRANVVANTDELSNRFGREQVALGSFDGRLTFGRKPQSPAGKPCWRQFTD